MGEDEQTRSTNIKKLSTKLTFSHAIQDHVNEDVSPSPACTVAVETQKKLQVMLNDTALAYIINYINQ